MPNWDEIVIQALRELKADSTLTRGAILRNKIEEISKISGDDFSAYLKESDQRFLQVLQKIEDVVIHRRPNTDMFVGIEGAEWPTLGGGGSDQYHQSKFPRLRSDLYDALTKISDRTYWYLPDSDEFTQEVPENESRRKIALPTVTLDQLREQRRGFAEQQSQEPKEELKRATDHSANPLADFQSVINRQRLGQSWHRYKSERLMEQIQIWAKQNTIEVSSSWLESDQSQENRQSPQQIMAHFAAFMTDDEIRSISVPFRAVEAMYRNINAAPRNSL